MRVGLVDGAYVINPTYPERKKSKIDLIVAGTKDAIVMVEAGAKEATEEEMVERARRGAPGDPRSGGGHRLAQG